MTRGGKKEANTGAGDKKFGLFWSKMEKDVDGLGIEPRTFRRRSTYAKRTLYQLSHTPLIG